MQPERGCVGLRSPHICPGSALWRPHRHPPVPFRVVPEHCGPCLFPPVFCGLSSSPLSPRAGAPRARISSSLRNLSLPRNSLPRMLLRPPSRYKCRLCARAVSPAALSSALQACCVQMGVALATQAACRISLHLRRPRPFRPRCQYSRKCCQGLALGPLHLQVLAVLLFKILILLVFVHTVTVDLLLTNRFNLFTGPHFPCSAYSRPPAPPACKPRVLARAS